MSDRIKITKISNNWIRTEYTEVDVTDMSLEDMLQMSACGQYTFNSVNAAAIRKMLPRIQALEGKK